MRLNCVRKNFQDGSLVMVYGLCLKLNAPIRKSLCAQNI